MHIRIKGRITVSGYRSLMATLRKTAPEEDFGADPFDVLNRDIEGQRTGYLTLESGTTLGITAFVGEKRAEKPYETPTHFLIEGSFKFMRTGEIEPIVNAISAEAWTSEDGDQFGPIIRRERGLVDEASQSKSDWPRPSRHPPSSDPPESAPTS